MVAAASGAGAVVGTVAAPVLGTSTVVGTAGGFLLAEAAAGATEQVTLNALQGDPWHQDVLLAAGVSVATFGVVNAAMVRALPAPVPPRAFLPGPTVALPSTAAATPTRVFYGMPNGQLGAGLPRTFYRAPNGALATSVWDLDTLLRGAMLRGTVVENRIGRSPALVQNFPVIDRWENGIATSIKSINLHARRYRTNSRLRSQVRGFIDEMAAYRGQPIPIGGIVIRPHQIRGRAVDLAIPLGGTQAQLDELVLLQAYARSRTNPVILNIIPIR